MNFCSRIVGAVHETAEYASVTRLYPAFRVRVWLREASGGGLETRRASWCVLCGVT